MNHELFTRPCHRRKPSFEMGSFVCFLFADFVCRFCHMRNAALLHHGFCVWLLFNRSSKAFVENADPVRRTLETFYWFIAFVVYCLKSGEGFFVSKKCKLTDWHDIRFGKHGRLGHVSGTRELSRGRSLRSIHFYLIFNNMDHGR